MSAFWEIEVHIRSVWIWFQNDFKSALVRFIVGLSLRSEIDSKWDQMKGSKQMGGLIKNCEKESFFFFGKRKI